MPCFSWTSQLAISQLFLREHSTKSPGSNSKTPQEARPQRKSPVFIGKILGNIWEHHLPKGLIYVDFPVFWLKSPSARLWFIYPKLVGQCWSKALSRAWAQDRIFSGGTPGLPRGKFRRNSCAQQKYTHTHSFYIAQCMKQKTCQCYPTVHWPDVVDLQVFPCCKW